MNVLLFGATGMIGHGVLLECLDADDVESVVAVGRASLDIEHPKLVQIQHSDFTDFTGLTDQFASCDACFYCLGVSAAGMSEDRYRHITYDFTVAVAKTLVEVAPQMTFCFISGAGTSLQSRQMWARVKAEAEEIVKEVGFAHAYCLRPGYIQPMRGVTSKVASYRAMYAVTTPFYSMLKKLPKWVCNSAQIGQAMLNAVRHKPEQVTLESVDIVALAER